MKKLMLTAISLFVVYCSTPYRNYPPQFVPIPDQYVRVGQLLTFGISAEDPNQELFDIEVVSMPEGARFNNETGYFEWTPSDEDIGEHWFIFAIKDTGDPPLTTYGSVKIIVLPEVDTKENHPPVIQPLPQYNIYPGDTLAITIMVFDPDEDQITIDFLSDLPIGAIFNPEDNTFTWVPAQSQIGSHNIIIRATDNGNPPLFDIEILTINVLSPIEPNRYPPELVPIPGITTMARYEFTITLEATDPEGTQVSFGIVNPPENSNMETTTGIFTWTPSCSDVGTHQLVFYATDSGTPPLSSYIVVEVEVTDELCTELTDITDPSQMLTPIHIDFEDAEVGATQITYDNYNVSFDFGINCSGEPGEVIESGPLGNSKQVDLKSCQHEVRILNGMAIYALGFRYIDDATEPTSIIIELYDDMGLLDIYETSDPGEGESFFGVSSTLPFNRAVIITGDYLIGNEHAEGWIDDYYLQF